MKFQNCENAIYWTVEFESLELETQKSKFTHLWNFSNKNIESTDTPSKKKHQWNFRTSMPIRKRASNRIRAGRHMFLSVKSWTMCLITWVGSQQAVTWFLIPNSRLDLLIIQGSELGIYAAWCNLFGDSTPSICKCWLPPWLPQPTTNLYLLVARWCD